ncbi:MAG: hypothetical protein LBD74_05125, partial [Spirochaetaceae bacterium]|nr:hypothetical protein [Spirochaetaceae bacterium]
MGKAIPNPAALPSQGLTQGYQRQNTLLSLLTIGFANIDLSPIAIDDPGMPDQVLQGSRFELNSILYTLEVNEPIVGTTVDGQNYIYAELSGNGLCRFVYSKEEPTYEPLKGGYYWGDKRCFGSFIKNGGICSEKQCFNALERCVAPQAIEILKTSLKAPLGKEKIRIDNDKDKVELGAGLYCFDVSAGGGGAGGKGKNGSNGGDGGAGGRIIELVRLSRKMTFYPVLHGSAAQGGIGGYIEQNPFIRITILFWDLNPYKFWPGGSGSPGGAGAIAAVLCKDFPYALAAFGGNGGGGGGAGTGSGNGGHADQGGEAGSAGEDEVFGIFYEKVT